MTQILISDDLQSHELQSFPLKGRSTDLVSAAINRALDARKVLGGGSNVDPTHIGPYVRE